jgi:hypothetical protein
MIDLFLTGTGGAAGIPPLALSRKRTQNPLQKETQEEDIMENNTKQELKICQSCGMPMQEDQYGTNQDGSRNETYCCYCYKDGAFAQDCTLDEMIDFCAPFEVEGGRAKTLEEAKAMLGKYFPTLERWRA